MTDLSERAKNAALASLVDDIDDYAIFMLAPDGTVATWNSGACRIKGYEPDEIVGRHFSLFFPDEAVAAGRPEQLLAQASDEGRVADEDWRVRSDGTRFWGNVVITALHDDDGSLRGFVKVTRDETDRRSAQRQARQLEALRDRERLAVELNAAVVNRVFAAGLAIQGLRQLLTDSALQNRLDAIVSDLDAAINDLRLTLFEFNESEATAED